MRRLKVALRWLLALNMVGVGALHFINPSPFIRIVPAWVPDAALAVYVSGVAEVLGGLGLLHPRTRVTAAWGLVALYVAVFPANVNMAVNHIQMGDAPLPPWAPWVRLPFQALFIAWACWNTRPDRDVPTVIGA